MLLIGGSDIATSIMVIPCDKQPLFHLNVKKIPEGKHIIIYGNFEDQIAFARKCICGMTPCQGVITTNWHDMRYNALVPIGDTYEEHIKNVALAKDLTKSAYGCANVAVEAIQEHYKQKISQ